MLWFPIGDPQTEPCLGLPSVYYLCVSSTLCGLHVAWFSSQFDFPLPLSVCLAFLPARQYVFGEYKLILILA